MVRFNLHARTNCIWPIKAWESFHANTNLFLKKLELHYLWTEGAVINGFGGFWAYLCMFNHVHVYIYICARPTSLGAALLWYGCPEFSVVIFFLQNTPCIYTCVYLYAKCQCVYKRRKCTSTKFWDMTKAPKCGCTAKVYGTTLSVPNY